MTTALASSARRAIRSRNTKFFVSVAWGNDAPLVGIAGSLFFGRGRRVTETPDARRARHAQKRQSGRFFRCAGTISCGRSVLKADWKVSISSDAVLVPPASITPSCYPALPGPVTAPEQLSGATELQPRQREHERRPSGRFRRTFWDPLAQPPFSGIGRAWRPKNSQDAAPGSTTDPSNSNIPPRRENRRVDALAPAENNDQAAD